MRRSLLVLPLVGLLALGGCAQVDAKAANSAAATSAATSAASGAASSAAATPAPGAESSAATPAATPATAAPADKAALDAITIDVSGVKPMIKGKYPVKVSAAVAKVVKEGTGAALTDGMPVGLQLSRFDLNTGAESQTNFGSKAGDVKFTETEFPPELFAILRSAKVGVYGAYLSPSQDASAGAQLIVFQIVEEPKLEPAKVVDPATMPKITLGATPTFTKPTTAAPTETTVGILKEGTGAVVTKGQSVTVKYAGWKWSDGAQFDASYGKTPDTATFGIGVGGVINCWDTSLVGQKIGSTLELSCSAADSYGETTDGQRPAGALVFLVEIVSAEAAK